MGFSACSSNVPSPWELASTEMRVGFLESKYLSVGGWMMSLDVHFFSC